MESQEYWDSLYAKEEGEERKEDRWLDEYKDILCSKRTVLDLGCGDGYDTASLLSYGLDTTSADFSKVALNRIKRNYPETKVIYIDMREKFPFKDSSFDVVVADLSLHYFTQKETERILSEIQRVLVDGGLFLARVNAIDDFNFGAQDGLEIEKHLYLKDGRTKRFFSEEDCLSFFSGFAFLEVKKASLFRYGKEKRVYQIKGINLRGVKRP